MTQTQNVQITSKARDKWHFTNRMLEAGKPEKCNVKNTTTIQNSSNKDNPKLIDKK